MLYNLLLWPDLDFFVIYNITILPHKLPIDINCAERMTPHFHVTCDQEREISCFLLLALPYLPTPMVSVSKLVLDLTFSV